MPSELKVKIDPKLIKPVHPVLARIVPKLERVTREVIIPRAEKLMENVNYRYVNGAEDTVREAGQNGDTFFLISNHQAQTDIFSGLGTIRWIRRIVSEVGIVLPNNFYVLGAKSMWTGHQGLVIKILNDAMCERLLEEGVVAYPVTRESDADRYKLPLDPYEVRPVVSSLWNDQGGLMVYPEGTMKPGRTRREGRMGKFPFTLLSSVAEDINGMVTPSDHMVDFMARLLSLKRGVTFIEISTHGAHRLLSPNYGMPTPGAWASLFTDYSLPPIEVVVDAISLDRIKEELPRCFNKENKGMNMVEQFILNRIRSRLPLIAQGASA
jgi:hypothetical protein